MKTQTAFALPTGTLTALVTPFNDDFSINWQDFERLANFQHQQGVSGIVPAGTTGESPTLDPREHDLIIRRSVEWGKTFVMPGCGSNSTKEARHYMQTLARAGGKAALLVDPYYNGPSSRELRLKYYAPLAEEFPGIMIIPYVIPGRTGTALHEWDLASLSKEYLNICAVKEATGDKNRMAHTRQLTSPAFQIFSGDDDLTLAIMASKEIKACGVISVISNIAPRAVQDMCIAALRGDMTIAQEMERKLAPLFKLVTVFADRADGSGVTDKIRNPLPIKTMMAGLGMPVGPCRTPLGKMSRVGMLQVRETLKRVWRDNPEILRPIEDFFCVDIATRLDADAIWQDLCD